MNRSWLAVLARAASGQAVEHWRSHLWSRSSNCRRSVYILIARSRKHRLSHSYAIDVSSFLKLSRKDAFLEAVASENVSDQILRNAVFDLLVTWLSQIRARASDLEADPHVVAAKDQLLPEALTLME